MKTQHFWFRSGNYSLLGHIDASPEHSVRLGAVIVPPLGWEDSCSYRPLRFMARTLAGAGVPTLRYDLPGTGDSSGDALDSGLFAAWLASVDQAALELRKATGVDDVALVGIHWGAMLSALAAARGGNFQELVLWGAASSGRAILRELRAVANVERWESLSAEEAPPPPLPGLETGGFLLSPETIEAIENLDLSTVAAPQCRRVLLLSRDNLPHDARLTGALQSTGVTIDIAAGPGYSSMMTLPHEAVPPERTSLAIAGFLTRGRQTYRPAHGMKLPATCSAIRSGIFECTSTIQTPDLTMFGILSEPGPNVPRNDLCVLYLNPGGVRHIGPNRMWVESARRWAECGVMSLRLDLQGIGESEGEPVLDIPNLYHGRLVRQIEAAMDWLRDRHGIKRFALIGLCSGAFWAFHAALRNPEIRAAVLLNPRLFFWDPGVDQRRMLRRTAQGLTRWSDWSRLLRGGIRGQDIARVARVITGAFRRERNQPEGKTPAALDSAGQAWSLLEHLQQRVLLVFREGEPLLQELEDSQQLPPKSGSFVGSLRIPNGGHTFRPLWAQQMCHEIIDRELKTLTGAPAAPRMLSADEARV